MPHGRYGTGIRRIVLKISINVKQNSAPSFTIPCLSMPYGTGTYLLPVPAIAELQGKVRLVGNGIMPDKPLNWCIYYINKCCVISLQQREVYLQVMVSIFYV